MTSPPKVILITLLFLSVCTLQAAGQSKRFAVAQLPTPVFNTPHIREIFGGEGGTHLKTDRCNQIRELEFIALPGTVFSVQKEISSGSSNVYQVTSADYPYPASGGYFVDSRAVRLVSAPPPDRPRSLPRRDEILDRLRGAAGIRYTWGGNVRDGIPELLELYPQASGTKRSFETRARRQLAGLDCSGLLYEATGGWTPRNTSSLAHFGNPLVIAGQNAETIAERVHPLDLIVWPGHVLIILDRNQVIESRLSCNRDNDGVIITPLLRRLKEVMKLRHPMDDLSGKGGREKEEFVIRRWFGIGEP